MPNLETLLSMEDEVNAVLNDLGIPEKLSEMDDFMNQNDLKVNITNENAVVTGLVTYTCTVKDKDNNALANKVVEWYKGTTLLGMDATDSNGISTFSHRVTEADIYDVHAVVRGTHAGDDIRMFVKDKSNILNHGAWCFDYEEAHNIIGNNIGLSKSNEWCSNGELSLKNNITLDSTSQYIGLTINTFPTNVTLKFSCDISTPVNLKLNIFKLIDGNWSTTNVDIPKGENIDCSLSLPVTEDITRLWIRIDGTNLPVGTVFYIDNLSLKEEVEVVS